MNVKTVREAIATALDIPGVQVSAYVLSNPTAPTIQVLPGPSERLAMQRGLIERDFRVQAMCGLTSDVGAQQLLDQLLDDGHAKSVIVALRADPTFGGAVEHSDVVGDTGVEVFTRDGGPAVIGSEWTVRVLASG